MSGFRNFLMRGNLIELAVAFIMGGAFATVVTAFTKLLMDIIGRFIGTPDFSQAEVGGVNYGVFLTALVSFLILSFVVYFFVVKPYQAMRDRLRREGEPEAESTEAILADIRDLLAGRGATHTAVGPATTTAAPTVTTPVVEPRA